MVLSPQPLHSVGISFVLQAVHNKFLSYAEKKAQVKHSTLLWDVRSSIEPVFQLSQSWSLFNFFSESQDMYQTAQEQAKGRCQCE